MLYPGNIVIHLKEITYIKGNTSFFRVGWRLYTGLIAARVDILTAPNRCLVYTSLYTRTGERGNLFFSSSLQVNRPTQGLMLPVLLVFSLVFPSTTALSNRSLIFYNYVLIMLMKRYCSLISVLHLVDTLACITLPRVTVQARFSWFYFIFFKSSYVLINLVLLRWTDHCFVFLERNTYVYVYIYIYQHVYNIF